MLGINEPPVAIKAIERAIVDQAFEEGWIRRSPLRRSTGKRVAVVGSGPAGLAAAQQLARMGHAVTVFEKSDRIGGLLRYGIPDFKMEKPSIDRRMEQMRAEGVVFETNTHIGCGFRYDDLRRDFDAVLLATGAEQPRDLTRSGRELNGIHFAMDFLTAQNRVVAGDAVPGADSGDRKTRGDPGRRRHGRGLSGHLPSTERRERASVRNSADAAGQRATRPRRGPCGRMSCAAKARMKRAERAPGPSRRRGFRETTARREAAFIRGGEESEMHADLVLLAMGFTGPVREGAIEQLGVTLDGRGNVAAEDFQTSVEGVFAAGDSRRGQSLIVWAIAEGRRAASAMPNYGSVNSITNTLVFTAKVLAGLAFGNTSEVVIPVT